MTRECNTNDGAAAGKENLRLTQKSAQLICQLEKIVEKFGENLQDRNLEHKFRFLRGRRK
jgi:hypothetical protein